MQLQMILSAMAVYVQGDSRRRIQSLHYQELQRIAQGFNDMVNALEYQKDELDQQQQSFRMLTDTLPQIVWTAHADGWVDYYNQQWFDYTGMTLEQTQGQGWEPVLHPNDLHAALDIWKRAMEQEESYQMEIRLKRVSDGAYRWHLARALPIRDSGGTVIKWFGTSTDIEELKQAEQVLIQANQDQHNFVSTVSHEFRTTLTSIQGFSELLGNEDFQPEEVKDYANDIYTDALRLTRMITDLLDLEKMQAGHMTLHVEEVDVNALVSEVVAKMNLVSAHHCIDLKLDTCLPKLKVDQDKMIQVIYNLLTNAVKYSPEGGHILVETTREGSQIHICVQDQGIGIPKEAREKIFRPYNRVHAEDLHYIKGTGLGLPIVRHLIDMHGGRVWVESNVGQGSVFHILLPFVQPTVAVVT
jgi:PAS domain S-box-containing protein